MSTALEIPAIFSLLVTCTFQLVFFAIAAIFRFDKVTDISGALNFQLVALISLFRFGRIEPRQLVVTVMVLIWSVRLGVFLFTRVWIKRKDSRFDSIRAALWKFFGFWLVQIGWIWTVSLPIVLLNSAETRLPLSRADYIGWAMWLCGFWIETAADRERHIFNHKPRQPRGPPFLHTGLWAYSRHPNYFGEWLLWTGIWVTCANALLTFHPFYTLISLSSPILTFVLLVFISGIPITEQREDRKHGRLVSYRRYKQETSPFILLPPWLYRRIKPELKRSLLFERNELPMPLPRRVLHSH